MGTREGEGGGGGGGGVIDRLSVAVMNETSVGFIAGITEEKRSVVFDGSLKGLIINVTSVGFVDGIVGVYLV